MQILLYLPIKRQCSSMCFINVKYVSRSQRPPVFPYRRVSYIFRVCDFYFGNLAVERKKKIDSQSVRVLLSVGAVIRSTYANI